MGTILSYRNSKGQEVFCLPACVFNAGELIVFFAPGVPLDTWKDSPIAGTKEIAVYEVVERRDNTHEVVLTNNAGQSCTLSRDRDKLVMDRMYSLDVLRSFLEMKQDEMMKIRNEADRTISGTVGLLARIHRTAEVARAHSPRA